MPLPLALDWPESGVLALEVVGVGDFSFPFSCDLALEVDGVGDLSFLVVLAEDVFGVSFALVERDFDVLFERDVEALDVDLPRDFGVFFGGCGS